MPREGNWNQKPSKDSTSVKVNNKKPVAYSLRRRAEQLSVVMSRYTKPMKTSTQLPPTEGMTKPMVIHPIGQTRTPHHHQIMRPNRRNVQLFPFRNPSDNLRDNVFQRNYGSWSRTKHCWRPIKIRQRILCSFFMNQNHSKKPWRQRSVICGKRRPMKKSDPIKRTIPGL